MAMAKNTSILIGDYFDRFISNQVQTGRFSSASEVVRAALRLFEQAEMKKQELVNELKTGEKSKLIEDFDSNKFLREIHSKYSKDEL